MARTAAWTTSTWLLVSYLSITATHLPGATVAAQDDSRPPAVAEPTQPASPPVATLPPATLPPATPPAAREKRFGDWATMRVDLAESRLCFAVTRARNGSASGAAAAEGRTGHVHVASWPQAGVKAEVSVRAGIPLRQGVPAQIAIGNEQFTLFTKQDGAYIENPIDELKLLEAMKKGSQMSFSAQSEAGNAVHDTFSLSGLGAALAHVTHGCP